jgi:hypothetical protein
MMEARRSRSVQVPTPEALGRCQRYGRQWDLGEIGNDDERNMPQSDPPAFAETEKQLGGLSFLKSSSFPFWFSAHFGFLSTFAS